MGSVKTYPLYVSVIPERAVGKLLDYGVSEEWVAHVVKGAKVKIPLGRSTCTGYVFETKDKPNYPRVKPIIEVSSPSSLLTHDLFELATWMAQYYCTPLHDVLKTILPASLRKETKEKQQLYVMRAKTREVLIQACIDLRKRAPAQASVLDVMLKVTKGILLTELLEEADVSRSSVDALQKKGLLAVDTVRIDRSPLVDEEYFRTKAKVLTGEQAESLQTIKETIDANVFKTHLIRGVTGSGKTEVYLQAISRARQLGKGTIMLVPEVALTPQTIERFRSRFEDDLVVLHHRLSDGERFDAWHRLLREEAHIIIGARSAVFAPLPNLGLIIVDEEHEGSYKQSEFQPSYHARDIAVMRGKLCNGCVLLGSATPSLESSYNAEKGKYHLSVLSVRADKAKIPKMTVVDMNREREGSTGYRYFSATLLDALSKRHALGEQSILFLNRRGYHTSLFCKNCQEAIQCTNCDTSLTFHRNESSLSCHLCGFTLSPPPRECPKCKSQDTMKYKGVGTEQIENVLRGMLKEVRTLRVDADTTRHKGSHQKLLREFGSGKADVLIGTQMIAKGLHFPNVTLVAVINADAGLNIPDFRASEVTFQLLTQVAGRSGRGELPGEVIIQTFAPDNPILKLAINGDYEAFYQEELRARELFQYPPVKQMVKVAFTGSDQALVNHTGCVFRERVIENVSKEYEVQPLLPAGHARVKGRFRMQFLITGPSVMRLAHVLQAVKEKISTSSALKILIDIQPISTFF